MKSGTHKNYLQNGWTKSDQLKIKGLKCSSCDPQPAVISTFDLHWCSKHNIIIIQWSIKKQVGQLKGNWLSNASLLWNLCFLLSFLTMGRLVQVETLYMIHLWTFCAITHNKFTSFATAETLVIMVLPGIRLLFLAFLSQFCILGTFLCSEFCCTLQRYIYIKKCWQNFNQYLCDFFEILVWLSE